MATVAVQDMIVGFDSWLVTFCPEHKITSELIAAYMHITTCVAVSHDWMFKLVTGIYPTFNNRCITLKAFL